MELPERFAAYEHPTWLTAVATALSYGLILAAMTVVLFVVPYIVFMQLG
ncbi:hypothetical protein ACFPYI_03130 [Halomarina salina]|uniref:Uncharacterized protein n=1 Tax=Halomarina salina TaxID=1872699 RepID=A0ABD5RID9_9EURY|nr:hypothetical protein [Halomarina salina]